MLHKNKKIAILALTPALNLTQTLTLSLICNPKFNPNPKSILTQTLTIP